MYLPYVPTVDIIYLMYLPYVPTVDIIYLMYLPYVPTRDIIRCPIPEAPFCSRLNRQLLKLTSFWTQN